MSKPFHIRPFEAPAFTTNHLIFPTGCIYGFHMIFSVPRSSVGIVTDYGLDGPGIESRWMRDYPHLSGPDLEPTEPPVQ